MTTDIRPSQGEIVDAIRLASRAPSIYNSQPWRWELSGSTLHLYARRERGVSSTDPTGRELTICLGVVLGHLQMVMEGFGWRCATTVLPDPNHSEHIAEIMFRRSPSITEGQRHRLESIAVRRTDRLPMTPPPDWDRFFSNLHAILEPSEVVLDVVRDAGRTTLVEASVQAASNRAYDSRYNAEMTWWSHRDEQSSDGIADSALVTAAEYGRVGLAREFPAVDRPQRHMTVEVDAARVIILSTISDDIRDVIACGRVLSTVLIEATCVGYATCTVSHVTENSLSRSMIGSLTTGTALPQVLVRVGMTSDDTTPEQTHRRGTDDISRGATP